MTAYLYRENVSPRDRFNRVELQLDTGSTAVIKRGSSYNLSPTEVARVQPFIVLQTVGSADAEPVEITKLSVVGPPEEGDVPVWRQAYGAFVAEQPTGGSGGGAVPTLTADTGDPYKVILLSTGIVRAIPFATPVPALPTSLAAVASVSSARLTWNSAPTAARTIIYRGGIQIAAVVGSSYRDIAVTLGQTYTYAVQTEDQYGQRSAISSTVSAFINPALNQDPVVAVSTWPATIPSNGLAIVRINASDPDAQNLTLAATVNTGSLAATADPSVKIRSAAGPITVTATATDPLSASDQAVTTFGSGGAIGAHVLRRTMLEDRVNWGSVNDNSAKGPSLTSLDPGQTPAGPLTLGHTFTMQRNATLVGARIYKHPSLSGSIPVLAWNSAGTLLSSTTATWVSDTGGWRTVMFDTPVTLVNAAEYTVGYYVPNSNYVSSIWIFNGQDYVAYPFVAKVYVEQGGAKFDGMAHHVGAGAAFPNFRTPGNYYIDPIAEWVETFPTYDSGTSYFDQFVNA